MAEVLVSFIRKTEIGSRRSAFTLVELLMVVGIIAILVSITIPIVGKVRRSAQEAATRALIGQIESAAQQYFNDFSAYPGPFSHAFMVQSQQQLGLGGDPLYQYNSSNNFTDEITNGAATAGYNGLSDPQIKRLTGTENLVLGLMGGLISNNPADPTQIKYAFKRDDLGQGAIRFNPKRPGRANSYMQPTNLSEGHFVDEAGAAKDTIVPEFVDSFSNPMPILYLRARKSGEANTATALDDKNNHIVIDETGNNALVGQYNLLEIAAYTQSTIGVGRSVSTGYYRNHQGTNPHGLVSVGEPRSSRVGSRTSASAYPFDAYSYLLDPVSDELPTGTSNRTDAQLKKHRARKQDTFILISAGIDRVYGTEDDLTNFGPVVP